METPNTTRASCWSITINNPTADDYERVASCGVLGWTVKGQVERGANGTYHYQMMVRTPQIRFSAVKKQFPRAHIEVAKNPAALAKYVVKEETREGELPTSERYPSLSRLWTLLYQRNNTGEKDGWNMMLLPGEVSLYRDEDHKALERNPLAWFDEQISSLIEDGFHVETLAVNPQVRSCWKNYWRALLVRAANEQEIIATESIPNALEEVSVPTLQEEGAAPPPPQSACPPSPPECPGQGECE